MVVLGAAMALGVLAGPAWAHVLVEATPGAPGAVDAVLKITAAGESATAGVAKLEVVADPAIATDQVTYVSGPSGWGVGPGGSSGGFTLSGPALAKGEDAVVSVKVKALPDAPQITFKVVESYSDGDVERWIELPGPDGAEPDKPAPLVKLSAGSASAVSPKPANDDAAAAAGSGSLARSGAGDRSLALAAGLFLLAGGWSITAGVGRRKRLAIRPSSRPLTRVG
jgi:hypothetical protein